MLKLMSMARACALTAAMAALALAPASAAGPRLSDAVIKDRMIRDSVAAYPGPCACPYNVARNGSRCGRRSAWSRAGGYAPICYASDIRKEDVESWRRANGVEGPQ